MGGGGGGNGVLIAIDYKPSLHFRKDKRSFAT